MRRIRPSSISLKGQGPRDLSYVQVSELFQHPASRHHVYTMAILLQYPPGPITGMGDASLNHKSNS